MSASSMIEANQLTKHYGKFIASENVSFKVGQGEVVAFLGPNGAGKSTTMKMLTGYLAPTSGTASISGYNVRTHRLDAARHLGYLPENGPLYVEMTPHEMLAYCGRVRGMGSAEYHTRYDYVVNACSLKSVIHKAISKLSKGFRQRVGMAQALLHNPPVLILDEPTSGLDPVQTAQARELIKTLSKDKTILLSTHILTEVQAVCHRVILINNGRLLFDGETKSLSNNVEELEQKFRSFVLKDNQQNKMAAV